MKAPQNDICPMFGDRCRHLSVEKTARPYTEIERDPKTGLYKPKRNGRTVVVLGEYCNDAGKYVRDMHYCPVKYSLANPIKTTTKPKAKPKAKPKPTVRKPIGHQYPSKCRMQSSKHTRMQNKKQTKRKAK